MTGAGPRRRARWFAGGAARWISWQLRWTLVLFVALFLLLMILHLAAPAVGRGMLEETSVIEMASPLFWFLAAAAAVVGAIRQRRYRLDLLLLAVVTAALGLRELDLHRAFGWSITRMINYTKEFIPLGERLTAFFLILLPVAVSLVILTIRGLRRFRGDWQRGASWPILLVQWCLILVAAMVLDKLSGAAENAGLLGTITWLALVSAEESLELALSVFTLLVFLPLAMGKRLAEPVV
jgi:hypothetical protein